MRIKVKNVSDRGHDKYHIFPTALKSNKVLSPYKIACPYLALMLFVIPRDQLKQNILKIIKGGHLGYMSHIEPNNTWSAPHKEHLC